MLVLAAVSILVIGLSNDVIMDYKITSNMRGGADALYSSEDVDDAVVEQLQTAADLDIRSENVNSFSCSGYSDLDPLPNYIQYAYCLDISSSPHVIARIGVGCKPQLPFDPQNPCISGDISHSFYEFGGEVEYYLIGDEEPLKLSDTQVKWMTNIQKSGAAIQMAAGYEGKGKSASKEGVKRMFAIDAEGKSKRFNNSEIKTGQSFGLTNKS